MKVFGQLEKAQIENLAADPTGTGLVPGLVWFNTTEAMFKAYDGTSVTAFADLNAAQLFMNKTFTDPVFTGAFTSQEEPSVPATPPLGSHKTYYRNGLLHTLNDQGIELPVGSGSGTGSKNYFDTLDTDFDASIGNWLTDNGVGGGASGLTIALTSVAGEVLAGSNSLKLSKDAVDRNGEFIKVALLEIDPADRGRRNFGTFEFRSLAGYESGDLSVELYDTTNAAVLFSGPPESLEISAGKGRVSFVTSLPETTAQIEFRLKVTSTSAVAYDVVVDEFLFGPRGTAVIPGSRVVTTYFASGPVFGHDAPGATTGFIPGIDPEGSVTDGAFTAPRDGLYHITGTATFGPVATSRAGLRNILAFAAGSTECLESANFEVAGASGEKVVASFSRTIQFAAGDVIAFSATHDGTGLVLSEFVGFDICIEEVNEAAGSILTDYELALKKGLGTVYLASDFSVNTLSEVKIPFDTSDIDTVGFTDVANNRLVVPESGIYRLSGLLGITNLSDGAEVTVSLRKNVSTTVIRKILRGNQGVGNSFLSRPLLLEQGDFIEAFCIAIGDANYDIRGGLDDSFLSLERIEDLSIYGAVQGVDEYIETVYADSSSNITSTTTYSTPGATEFELPLTPGVWDVGYATSVDIQQVSGAGAFQTACKAALHLDGSVVADTETVLSYTLLNINAAIRIPCSNTTRITVIADSNLQLRFSANGGGSRQVRMTNLEETGLLSGSQDSAPKIWARRVK